MFGIPERKWFERSEEQIRSGGFQARIIEPGQEPVAAVGTAVSPSGVAFLTKAPLKRKELELRMQLRERRFTVRLLVERTDKVVVKNEQVDRHFGRFTGIAADDWDLVVRYVKDLPEPEPTKSAEAANDNEFRMLTVAIRDKIVQKLVEEGRLARPEPGVEPLIRFRSDGLVKGAGGTTIHNMTVESRKLVGGVRQQYISQFAHHQQSGVVELLK